MQSNNSVKTDPAERVRVAILGGGIHGVGVAHDLTSRGWRDVVVIEKSSIGHGTSSRSTKLIHGGLRYLEHFRDFPLVAEGLRERKLLMELAPDLVKPIPLAFPVMASGGMPRFMIKAGLTLYDMLAGRQGVGRHYSLNELEISKGIPGIDREKFKHFYVFYDGQTDDLALVRRVAKSAECLGARIYENSKAERLLKTDEGFEIETISSEGVKRIISARYVVNAMGPWAHDILNNSNIQPYYDGVNNKGSHILIQDSGLKMGVFLQSPEDKRIFFVLPWKGKTLIGTTETPFLTNPDSLSTNPEDVEYLLSRYNRYFRTKINDNSIEAKFSGLRWLARDKNSNLSDTSRSHIVSEHRIGKGVIYTIYGGKLTAYRALAEEIGDKLIKHYGDDTTSRTDDPSTWNSGVTLPEEDLVRRFSGM